MSTCRKSALTLFLLCPAAVAGVFDVTGYGAKGDGVKIRGISIINHMNGPNTDGIDPDSSRNVHISDCYIAAGDDCIVLKTTGRGVEWPITIDLEKRAPDSRLSRIRDVSFSGMRMYTKGRVLVNGMAERPIESLSFSNVVMRITGHEAVEHARKLRGGTAQAVSRDLDPGNVPAAWIFVNAKDVELRDVEVIWDATEPSAR